jgi:hypothetical protein
MQSGAAAKPTTAMAERGMNEGFACGVTEQLGWYVYLLVDPRDDAVFYVGKGTGQRCFAHVGEARAMAADALGDYEKLSRIRAIEASGQSVDIQLLRHGLNEGEALLLEAACIDLLEHLTNRVAGHGWATGLMSVAHANWLYGARPVELDPAHPVILVRINRSYRRGMPETGIYEATRKWWKIAAWRRQLDQPGTPQWALGVANGIVRGVYRIEAWEQPGPADIAIDSKRIGRWGFRGHRDSALEARYLGGDVSQYLTSQSPLRFYP